MVSEPTKRAIRTRQRRSPIGRRGVLNLEKEPPALRYVLGFYTILYLKETLDRIEIPSAEEIPDAVAVRNEKISNWTIPYTEITIARVKNKSEVEEFLFTSDTVRNAEEYYNKVKDLPYKPQSGHGALLAQLQFSGSSILSKDFIDGLPAWTIEKIYGEAVWQWIGLVLYCCIGMGIILLLHKYGRKGLGLLDRRPAANLTHTVGGLILPVALILFSHAGLWFMVYGLCFLNADAYLPIALVFLVVSYGGPHMVDWSDTQPGCGDLRSFRRSCPRRSGTINSSGSGSMS